MTRHRSSPEPGSRQRRRNIRAETPLDHAQYRPSLDEWSIASISSGRPAPTLSSSSWRSNRTSRESVRQQRSFFQLTDGGYVTASSDSDTGNDLNNDEAFQSQGQGYGFRFSQGHDYSQHPYPPPPSPHPSPQSFQPVHGPPYPGQVLHGLPPHGQPLAINPFAYWSQQQPPTYPYHHQPMLGQFIPPPFSQQGQLSQHNGQFGPVDVQQPVQPAPIPGPSLASSSPRASNKQLTKSAAHGTQSTPAPTDPTILATLSNDPLILRDFQRGYVPRSSLFNPGPDVAVRGKTPICKTRRAFTLQAQLDFALAARDEGNAATLASQVNIPASTLNGWVKKIHILEKYARAGFGGYMRLPGGGRCVKDKDLDNHLLKYVQTSRKAGSTVTVADLMVEGETFLSSRPAVRGGKAHKCSHGFVRGFMARHHLAYRARTQATAKVPEDMAAIIREWLSNNRPTLAGILGDKPSSAIINFDETPIWLDSPRTWTIAEKGSHEIVVRTTGNDKNRITVVLACAANGKKLPVAIIVRRKRAPVIADEYKGKIVVLYNETATMDHSLMVQYGAG